VARLMEAAQIPTEPGVVMRGQVFRLLLSVVFMLVSGLAAAPALHANELNYPNRPIRLIVPWPPGGATDVQMRALASAATRHLGQPIVVENQPGASGTIGPSAVANAKPDGYTLVQLHTGVFRQPHIVKTSYDPRTDFTYIMGLSAYTFGVVVRADSPLRSFNDLMGFAKANPGKLTYATHHGSPMFMVMETLAEKGGTKFHHIPTKGTADNNSLVLSGDVMASADGAGWAPLVNSGRFRLLVTWGEQRTKQWPETPTLRELGYDIVERSPYGLGGPRGMDPNVVKIIHDAFSKAMREPEHLAALDLLNQDIVEMSSDEFRRFAMDSFERQKALVEKFGLAQK